MLLTESREDKICVRHWQKLQLRLCATGYTLAPHATCSDCDFRLNHLVTLAAGVLGRVNKRGQTSFLIILQEVPGDRQSERQSDPKHRQILPAEPGEQNSASQN